MATVGVWFVCAEVGGAARRGGPCSRLAEFRPRSRRGMEGMVEMRGRTVDGMRGIGRGGGRGWSGGDAKCEERGGGGGVMAGDWVARSRI